MQTEISVMQTDYNCIGAYLDIEGFSLVRFDLSEGRYSILRAVPMDEPTQPLNAAQCGNPYLLHCVAELAQAKETVNAPTIALIGNVTPDITRYLLNNWQDETPIQIKVVTLDQGLENAFRNLRSIMAENRIEVEERAYSVAAALSQVEQLDRPALRQIYEGSKTLSLTLGAILHSISWLESQQIKHGMKAA